jgi:hypothetical protein
MPNIAMSPVTHAPDLLAWIDFKWLMAAEGRRVNLDRLLADPHYACHCLQLGAASGSPTLRERARHLLASLDG